MLPELHFADWRSTKDTLHLYAQIVGKVRLATSAPRNHWWHVPLYVDVRGLTTRRLHQAGTTFDITFDLIDHALVVRTADGRAAGFPIADGLSVARFDEQLHDTLSELGVDVAIQEKPFGVPTLTTPFAQDSEHASWDRDAVARFGRMLDWSDAVFEEFGGWFDGKTSPVHLYWHSFDLAMGRYSGRPAPPQDVDPVTKEAYSHEVIAFGFWAGDDTAGDAAYYSYTAPEPDGLRDQPLVGGNWIEAGSGSLALLPYETVRTAGDPRATLLAFLQSAYEAGARTGRLGDGGPAVLVVPVARGARRAARPRGRLGRRARPERRPAVLEPAPQEQGDPRAERAPPLGDLGQGVDRRVVGQAVGGVHRGLQATLGAREVVGLARAAHEDQLGREGPDAGQPHELGQALLARARAQERRVERPFQRGAGECVQLVDLAARQPGEGVEAEQPLRRRERPQLAEVPGQRAPDRGRPGRADPLADDRPRARFVRGGEQDGPQPGVARLQGGDDRVVPCEGGEAGAVDVEGEEAPALLRRGVHDRGVRLAPGHRDVAHHLPVALDQPDGHRAPVRSRAGEPESHGGVVALGRAGREAPPEA
jgi:hypothetical protein